ncbi:uncharacterized protein LOC124114727 [Haliotis rufescens]|uniref:uncharacterized protein LOC124114727 n=1 Tax=Haliotis rufescens TaxID=6454 RepID=UPI00201F89A2|nr:uncharacterized protein LOC124114727 [Haliotis rufescens]
MVSEKRGKVVFLLASAVLAVTSLCFIYVVYRNPGVRVCASADIPPTSTNVHTDLVELYPVPNVNSKTVHYFWCARKMFEFHNYLSILSVVKMVKPLKIVFHYTDYPVLDPLEYNSWFRDLVATIPYLVLDEMSTDTSCRNSAKDKLHTVQQYLLQHGGLYVGENTVFRQFPTQAKQMQLLFSFRTANKNEKIIKNEYLDKCLDGFIGVVPGTNATTVNESLTFSHSDMRACSMYDYEVSVERCLAVTVNLPVRPKDIWYIDINFGKLARLLFYGKSDVIHLQQDFKVLAPRISHYIWFGKRTLTYAHYLSVLSALYVARLYHVYFHGDCEPLGEFWETLKREENVTFVFMELPEFVFGNVVQNKAHANDVVKLYILNKYGGVNQDPDVLWTKPIEDSHLAYDSVMGFEWVKADGWPETFNIGVFIAKKHSKFVHEFLLTMKDYRDKHWIYNSGCLPYRVYERFPHVLHADRQLQVLCYKHKCHPPWFKDYNEYYMNDDALYFFIEWNVETLSVHLTFPKPYPEYTSQATLMASTGMYASIGRNILKKAGKI